MLVLLIAGLAVSADRGFRVGAGTDQIRTIEFRLDTPAGPGQPGTVSLDATLYLPAHTPAPAILVAHGFGGSKASVAADARELAGRGFVALTWSARGFGGSTGQIALDSPDYEVADASRFIDYLASRPEVILDGPGDPRVGVTGDSYGGALSLLLAAYDHRVDADVPVITWNDLGQALFPNAATSDPIPTDTPAHTAFSPDGVFKRGWAGTFFSAGLRPDRRTDSGALTGPGASSAQANPAGSAATASEPTHPYSAASNPTEPEPPRGDTSGQPPPGVVPGETSRVHLASTAPTTCGRFTLAVCQAYQEAATSGRLDPTTAALLHRTSPASVANRITAPTLLVQGESDTLFGLDQSDATAREIAGAGGTVAVLWYSGGHDDGAPGPTVRQQIGDWFERYLGSPSEERIPTDTLAPGELSYAITGGVRAGYRGTPVVRTVTAHQYPGLAGATPVRLDTLTLHGQPQAVLNPAGGTPAAITTLPGVGGLLGSLSGRLSAFSTELPGQTATFITDPLTEQLVIAGSARVHLSVAPVPGQPASAEAVLFGRLIEVAPDGRHTLLGGAVAPMRIPVSPGGIAEVAVTLPAVVAPVQAGQRLVLSIATTDQGFLGATTSSVWRISLVGGGMLAVPVVPGQVATASTVPRWPAVGIVALLGLALVTMPIGRIRNRWRRRAKASAPSPDAELPLVIDGLAKSYPGGITAVNGVSFRVQRNQVVGLLGPNGAGKTTVLRMLMGLIRPTAGDIRVYGHTVSPGADVLSRIGSFVEGPGFLPHLSGLRNLRLYWAVTGRPATDAHLGEVLEIAGLGMAVNRTVRTYSHGMRQRLAIAQAMLGLPDLLVLDEPTNGLDPPQIHAMREVLRRYASGGRAVLVSSHLLSEVEQTCDHVVVMHRGTVVADRNVADIVAGGGQASFQVDDPQLAARVLGGASSISAVEVEGDAVHANLNGMPRAEAVSRLVRAGVAVQAAGPRRRLEDAFLQLVGEDHLP